MSSHAKPCQTICQAMPSHMSRQTRTQMCTMFKVFSFVTNHKSCIFPRFRLRYSTTCNSYYRDWSDAIDPSAQGVISGWDKVLYSVDSVHRHINEDVGKVSSYSNNQEFLCWAPNPKGSSF